MKIVELNYWIAAPIYTKYLYVLHMELKLGLLLKADDYKL